MSKSTARGRWRTVAVGMLVSAAVACGGGGGTGGEASAPAAGPSSSGGAVSIAGFKFVPSDVEVTAGTEVVWTNDDPVAHTVQDNGELFPESPELAKGETFSFTYDTPGTYPYICGIHPYMKGTVTVS
ncbi:MAG TPA: cupredoxin family copper-binding protein [Acidimicrobiales bacterium]|nr:cupredoxin family copper-binding protein [Acidimicrobiales bacterium]